MNERSRTVLEQSLLILIGGDDDRSQASIHMIFFFDNQFT